METDRVAVVKEHLAFLLQYFRNPREVGSVAPSSPVASALMAKEIEPHHAPVLEIGPGTGSFTRAILARGVAPADLTLVETNSDFCSRLRRDFPGVQVHCMNAADLPKRDLFGGRKVGAVVSGVPFLLLKPEEAKAILSSVFECMAPDAALYQVTYGFKVPFPRQVMRELDLVATHNGRTLLNAPPASCYRLTRRSATRH
jgi:phospholipid N-methyltransferase